MTYALVHFRLVPYRLEDQRYRDDLVRCNYLPANDNKSIHKVFYLVSTFRSCACLTLRCNIIPLFALNDYDH